MLHTVTLFLGFNCRSIEGASSWPKCYVTQATAKNFASGFNSFATTFESIEFA